MHTIDGRHLALGAAHLGASLLVRPALAQSALRSITTSLGHFTEAMAVLEKADAQ